MTRVSTAGTYALMLNNLQKAQARQNEAGLQVSSQKKATDLKGFASNAEVLTATRGVQAKVDGFIDQTNLLASKMELQTSGLSQISTAATSARDAIANALAAENADTLMQELQGYFADAVSGLNARSNGHYLFAGGKIDDKPVTATTLAELTAAPTTASLFKNDQFKTTNRLDENTTVDTGFLASDIGTELFDQLKSVQAYVEANGPFSGTLTQTQQNFLKSVIPGFNTTYTNLTAKEGSQGVIQKQVEAAQTDLVKRKDSLEVIAGGITDADITAAISNLQAAQFSLQASAQVFASLKGSSLLDILQ